MPVNDGYRVYLIPLIYRGSAEIWVVWWSVFNARQRSAICYPSVCHTGGSIKNGWS